MLRLLRTLFAPILVVVLVAACGGGSDDAQTVGAEGDEPTEVQQPEQAAAETAPSTTLPAEMAATTVPPAETPVTETPVNVVAEPPVTQPPAEQPAAAAPTTGRVDGTYTASNQEAQTEVLLRVAGGDPVASVQGTGDLPFAFDGVAPGRYVIEASEEGPEVSDPNGAATSSSTIVRSAPFDLEAGYTWTFSCDSAGCGN